MIDTKKFFFFWQTWNKGHIEYEQKKNDRIECMIDRGNHGDIFELKEWNFKIDTVPKPQFLNTWQSK